MYYSNKPIIFIENLETLPKIFNQPNYWIYTDEEGKNEILKFQSENIKRGYFLQNFICSLIENYSTYSILNIGTVVCGEENKAPDCGDGFKISTQRAFFRGSGILGSFQRAANFSSEGGSGRALDKERR